MFTFHPYMQKRLTDCFDIDCKKEETYWGHGTYGKI